MPSVNRRSRAPPTHATFRRRKAYQRLQFSSGASAPPQAARRATRDGSLMIEAPAFAPARTALLPPEDPSAGVFLADAHGSCTYLDPGGRRLVGVSLVEGLGDGWSRNLPAEDVPRVVAEWKGAVAAGGTIRLTVRFRKPEGGLRHVRVLAEPFTDADGRVTGYVGFLREQAPPPQAAPAGSDKDLLGPLLAIDLGVEEARICLALWQGGPRTAREIAQELNLSRNTTYGLLRQLTALGLLRTTVARPARYTLAPLDDFVEEQGRPLYQRLQALEELRQAFSRPPPPETHVRERDWELRLSGSERIYRHARRMIEQARGSVQFLSTVPGALQAPGADLAVDALLEAARRGGEVQVVTSEVPPPPRIRPLPDHGGKLRRGVAPTNVQFLVVDHANLLAWASCDPSGGSDLAWTATSTGIVQTFTALFALLWEVAPEQ